MKRVNAALLNPQPHERPAPAADTPSDMPGFWRRAQYKYINQYFVNKIIARLFKYLLLIGLAFLILYPLLVKLSSGFMSQYDLMDSTVRFIPRNPTLFTFQRVIEHTRYFTALLNTAALSFLSGFIQMLVCAFVGYGLARFNFKGRRIVFVLVVFTILVPPQTYMISLFLQFRFFDIYGLIGAITGTQGVNILDSPWPVVILSGTGFAFKNGLFIFMMRQFYKGMPEELEEAAYVDGSGALKTFFRIMIPLSTSMMVTVFILAFAWQWTDTYYTPLFFTRFSTLSNLLLRGFEGVMVEGFSFGLKNGQPLTAAFNNAFSLLIIAPLVVIYLFAQRKLVEGVERSGIVG
jgi:multiple sugar transport system permease protein